MKDSVLAKANAFKGFNDIALRGEIVIYGSTYMANFPFYELANKSNLENAIYNRSIEGMTIDEALELLQPCVIDIAPSKVFLNLGEEDCTQADGFEKYDKIVQTLRQALPQTKIYLIGLQGQSQAAENFNKRMADLCDKKHIFFIQFSRASLTGVAQYKARFKELSCFFRSRPIAFSKAFAISSL